MQILLSGTDILADAKFEAILEEKFLSRLDKFLKRFNPDSLVAHTRLRRQGYTFEIQFQLTLPGGKQIVALTRAERFVEAVTELRTEVLRQIKDYKTRLIRRRRNT